MQERLERAIPAVFVKRKHDISKGGIFFDKNRKKYYNQNDT